MVQRLLLVSVCPYLVHGNCRLQLLELLRHGQVPLSPSQNMSIGHSHRHGHDQVTGGVIGTTNVRRLLTVPGTHAVGLNKSHGNDGKGSVGVWE